VPPPFMADAIARGEIDAFCVGEPWGTVAVERGAAELILPGAAIWQFAPEKVLAVHRGWAEQNRDAAAALLRATWRAARWISVPENIGTATEILAREAYLGIAAELLERVIKGRIITNSHGRTVRVPRAIEFFGAAATFPWRSQAAWIAEQLAKETGADPAELRAVARAAFRTDIYRDSLGPIGADLPGASEKLEGALAHRTEVASTLGKLILGPDSFCDGKVFDPAI
jgi:two-component system, oxyanion-binding sensor